MAVLIAISPCFACRAPFPYDPDRVPSVLVDPETGLPPDLNPDGTSRGPDADALRRSVRQPLCPPCCRRANGERRRRGLPSSPRTTPPWLPNPGGGSDLGSPVSGAPQVPSMVVRWAGWPQLRPGWRRDRPVRSVGKDLTCACAQPRPETPCPRAEEPLAHAQQGSA
jgi:hypothetical protein